MKRHLDEPSSPPAGAKRLGWAIEDSDDESLDMFSNSPVPEDLFAIDEADDKDTDGSSALKDSAALDIWDDSDGYYHFRLGDIVGGRYEVFGDCGRGVFSSVLRVRDIADGNRELVIKVIRTNAVMHSTGVKEIALLKSLADSESENRDYIVRLYSSFEHRAHLCLVFEPMYLNIRQVLGKSGGKGLGLVRVRQFALQLFKGLKHLEECRVVHGDIKPDNMLISESLDSIKLCDLGSGSKLDDCEPTPLLVSRFYRPPEIILGIPYGTPVDMWSIGCVLYEMFTGSILFAGHDNNEMLYLQMLLKGGFNKKSLKKGIFVSDHFDKAFAFEKTRTDPVTGKLLKKVMVDVKAKRDIYQELRSYSGVFSSEESKQISQLGHLMHKCLELDPGRRITPSQAIVHEFFKVTT